MAGNKEGRFYGPDEGFLLKQQTRFTVRAIAIRGILKNRMPPLSC